MIPTRLATCLALLLALSVPIEAVPRAQQGARAGGGGSPSGRGPVLNRPPRITHDLPEDAAVDGREELRFRVTVTDPEGDAVDLRLLNPPAGLVFDPLVGAASPATVEARWRVLMGQGNETLVFEANDTVHPKNRVRLRVSIRAFGSWVDAVLEGDVTGDGSLDLVGTAGVADPEGVQNAGEIHVWSGTSGTPRAVLRVPGAAPGDLLGTGCSGNQVLLADLDGDGVLDVVAPSPSADVGGVVDAGAVYVWFGGSEMSGIVAPDARLSLPTPSEDGNLGEMRCDGTRGTLIADVSGDGVLDLVVAAPEESPGGVPDAGLIAIWHGGGLAGTPAPAAVLTVPGASTRDYLGTLEFSGQGLHTVDVSGDGVLDVVAGTSLADAGGIIDAGAVYVWNGGAGLAGTVAPTATLTVLGAVVGDRLGSVSDDGSFYGGVGGLSFAEVSGDGTLDLIVGAALAGAGDEGAVYVWRGGGSLSGTPDPIVLADPLATPNATLGYTQGSRRGIHAVDVTGDGQRDVVVCAPFADPAGVSDAGAIYVWAGPLTSTPAQPSAVLSRVPGLPGDNLGYVDLGQGTTPVDLDGDGVLDLVVGAPLADVSVADSGGIFVWFGSAGLSGPVAPDATLHVPTALPFDLLAFASGDPVRVLDVTADGVLDVVGLASLADAGGVDTGAVYVWSGAAGFSELTAPSATLTVPGALPQDYLGYLHGDPTVSSTARFSIAYFDTPAGLEIGDVTGDGMVDLVVGASLADFSGVEDSGAIHVFEGGAGLSGLVTPLATLGGSDAESTLAHTMWGGMRLADLDGDGALDVVAATGMWDGGLGPVAADPPRLWTGGPSWSATVLATAVLDPGPSGPYDFWLYDLADLDRDGRVDVYVTEPAFWSGTPGEDAVHVFTTPFSGTKPPDGTLTFP